MKFHLFAAERYLNHIFIAIPMAKCCILPIQTTHNMLSPTQGQKQYVQLQYFTY
jgi:hypothetical protein